MIPVRDFSNEVDCLAAQQAHIRAIHQRMFAPRVPAAPVSALDKAGFLSPVLEIKAPKPQVQDHANTVEEPSAVPVVEDGEPPPPKAPLIAEIIDLVASVTKTRREELFSERRQRDLVRKRHMVMWLARRFTGRSLTKIGFHVGGKDHTTVIHGCRYFDNLIKEPKIGEPAEDTAEAWAQHLWKHRKHHTWLGDYQPRTISNYPSETKANAIAAFARGEGTKREIADRFGVPYSNLAGWIRRINTPEKPRVTPAGMTLQRACELREKAAAGVHHGALQMEFGLSATMVRRIVHHERWPDPARVTS
jgi:transposase-like protein